MRVGYLCMQSEFSTRPLRALLDAGHDVRFVMRPLSRDLRRAPVLSRDADDGETLARDEEKDPFALAARAGIPRFLVGDASSAPAQRLVEAERVDVLVVAFFNQLLRPALYERLPLGAVNCHPSLLPRYRGPSPLFWTFRDGCEETGVTVHRIDRGEDDGDVLLRAPEPIPFGVRGEELVRALGAHAARGAVKAIEGLASGTLRPTPQDPRRATHAPRPTGEALLVDPSLPARRVFAFARGVGRWNALRFQAGGAPLRVLDAVSLDEEGRLPGDYALKGDTLILQCSPGTVTLRVRPMR